MPRPSRRSRSLRRVFVRLSRNKSKLVYKKRKPQKTKCSSCNRELHGIKRLRKFKIRKTPKSQKRPERKFGGYLCSNCSRRGLIKKTRK